MSRVLGVLIAALAVALVVPACKLPSGFEAVGFKCATAGDCGGDPELVCTGGVCAMPVTPGGDSGIPLPPDVPYPVRVATYFLEYPYAWTQDGTAFQPLDGLYHSNDAGTVLHHLSELHQAHVDTVVAQWWGVGTASDVTFSWILSSFNADPMRWAISYAGDMSGTPVTSVHAASAILGYIDAKFGDNPSYWHIQGKNVIYVHTASGEDPCTVASYFVGANQQFHGNAFIILRARTGPALPSCSPAPDAWVKDDLTETLQQTPDVITVLPGVQEPGTDAGSIARDAAAFAHNLTLGLGDGGSRFQWIDSFNNWGDGTSVEPAKEWPSDSGFGTYIDMLHNAPIRP